MVSRAWALAMAGWVWAGAGALAQDAVASFYRGKTLTIVVGSSAGGGYDLYGRLIARFMGRHIPGSPNLVVQNMPGAASNIAGGYVANVAPKDGTVMGAIFMGATVEPLFGDQTKRAAYDVSRMRYIGNANIDAYLCLVRADAGVNSLGDALSREIVVGGTAEGSSTGDFPRLLKNLLGAKFRVVTGYPGTREINLAMEKGEIQGGCGQTFSSVALIYPHWFRDHLVRPLVQEANVGYPALDAMGVALARDFATSDAQRRVLELVYSQEAFGRPYVVAAETPPERVAVLRAAFMATLNDPDLIAEAKRISLDIAPTSGAELQALIAKLYATPADVVAQARAALAGGS